MPLPAVFDLHCDPLTAFMTPNRCPFTLDDPASAFALSRIPRGTAWCQCCAVFVPDGLTHDEAWRYYRFHRDRFFRQAERFARRALPCRTAEEVEGLCRLSGYRFTWELETSGLLTVGDDRLLRRMLLCMVSNAMKAAGRSGQLGLKLAVRGERAVVTVWNSGAPLGEEDLARFFGGESGLSLDPKRGLGLGLEVVRRTAELHGGAVMAESRDGVTQCAVSLPIRKPEGDAPLCTPRVDYSGGFSPALVELSDVLPPEIYNCEDLQ